MREDWGLKIDKPFMHLNKLMSLMAWSFSHTHNLREMNHELELVTPFMNSKKICAQLQEREEPRALPRA